MIVLTRLNGPPLAINCDLIERVEATPDTVVTLVEGTKYVVQESVDQVIERVREFRASVVVMSQRLEQEVAAEPSLRLVSQPVNVASVTRRNKLQIADASKLQDSARSTSPHQPASGQAARQAEEKADNQVGSQHGPGDEPRQGGES